MVLRLHETKCSSVPRTANSTASVARSVHQQLALNELLHGSHAHALTKFPYSSATNPRAIALSCRGVD